MDRQKIVTFGEIMLRLTPPDYLRFNQTNLFRASYGGSEANVAVSLANYGLQSEFVTRLPDNRVADACIDDLRRYGVRTDAILRGGKRLGIYYMEEAAAIAKLIAVYGLSQEQAAERLGKSQSAVANKLRLLRLSPACVALLREGGLSERHARALLRLSDENERLAALRVIVERGCNVAQAEAYIESVLQRAAVTPPRRRPTFIVKDVRLFLNTIRRSMGIMQRAGVDAACEREDTDEEIRLTIRIPRTGAAKTA